MLIGLILAATAVWLAYETQSLLIGESAAEWIREAVDAALENSTGIVTVNEVATLHMGPSFILVTISVDFESNMNSDDVESCVAGMTRKIKAIDPSIRRVFIEAEKLSDHRREIADSLPGAAPRS